jgi:hypothetical protein
MPFEISLNEFAAISVWRPDPITHSSSGARMRKAAI